eukprot:m.152205 g.152205  ORF g.152205 m.152205 type:complete len:66 (-) comp23385_c0_seq1:508-705(-)
MLGAGTATSGRFRPQTQPLTDMTNSPTSGMLSNTHTAVTLMPTTLDLLGICSPRFRWVQISGGAS